MLEHWSVGVMGSRSPPVVLAGRQLSRSVAVTSGRRSPQPRSPGAIVFNGARPI